MDLDKFLGIIDNLNMSFQGHKIEVFCGKHDGRIWAQVGMYRPDIDDPQKMEFGKGGKAYISEHATEDEVVKKILGLCLAYAEHEIREGFYYRGKRLFGPHISLDALMSVSDQIVGRTSVLDKVK